MALEPVGLVEQWVRADPLLPPLSLRWQYYRSPRAARFRQASLTALAELTSRGLQPSHRVLDLGCGIGNLAVGLVGWLRQDYYGLDVNARAIDWCRHAISTRWPNFRFHHVDLASEAYHRKGSGDATAFLFPLPADSIDVAFAGSLFTHLLPSAAEQYIRQCGRVLAPGGLCIASFFLLNDQTRRGLDAGESFMSFRHSIDNGRGRVHDSEVPEAAVALDEQLIRSRFAESGLDVIDIRRGGWWQGSSDDQDVITARRVRRSHQCGIDVAGDDRPADGVNGCG